MTIKHWLYKKKLKNKLIQSSVLKFFEDFIQPNKNKIDACVLFSAEDNNITLIYKKCSDHYEAGLYYCPNGKKFPIVKKYGEECEDVMISGVEMKELFKKY